MDIASIIDLNSYCNNIGKTLHTMLIEDRNAAVMANQLSILSYLTADKDVGQDKNVLILINPDTGKYTGIAPFSDFGDSFDDRVISSKEEPCVNCLRGNQTPISQNTDLYIRDSAAGEKVDWFSITTNAQLNAFTDEEGYSILRKGTRVTCKGTVERKGQIWMRIPSGFICARKASGQVYVE